MSTAAARPLPACAPARPGVTARRVLAAEWTKLTSVGGPAWAAVGTVVAAVGTAAALGMLVRPGGSASGAGLAVGGEVLAQLGFLALGVLVGTGEHAGRTAATTFAAVPRRLPVLGAQVVLTALAAAGTAAVAVVLAVAATSGARDAAGLALDLGDAGTVRVLAGLVLHGTGVALLGLALGAVLRHPAGALVTGVLLLVVVDHALAANPGRVTDTLRALLPGAGARLLHDDARLAALDATTQGPQLGAWGGGLVLTAWVLVLLAAGAVGLVRRDVR